MSFASINELSSGRYAATYLTELNQSPGALDTFLLTLYDKNTLVIINGRNKQNILNANQVTYDPITGNVVWNLLPQDNPILNPGLLKENHVALFVATWSGGTKQLTREVLITVNNLGQLL